VNRVDGRDKPGHDGPMMAAFVTKIFKLVSLSIKIIR
jgi:hypothetical protein